jgi:pimeloyl-ACP methyl ester carboxylesterase
MTVLALAGRHPALVRDRVHGVALVSTSSGDLDGLGRRGEGAVMRALSRVPVARAGRVVTLEGQRRLLWGEDAVPADVSEVRDIIAGTRLATIGWFHRARLAYDESASVAALANVPVRVLVGERDRLTPVRHARRLAELAPHAVLDIRPGVGHMLGYEATDVVVDHLRELVEGAA